MIDDLAARFVEAHPAQAARILETATLDVLGTALAALPNETAAAVAEEMAPHAVAAALETVDARIAGALIAALPSDAAAPLVLRLPAATRADVLQTLPGRVALPLRTVLRFPSGTVGALLDPHALALSGETTVREAIALARGTPAALRRYLYVLEPGQRLAGVVSSRACMLRDPEERLGDIADAAPVALRARGGVDAAGRNPAWERWDLLPVVDHRGVFLGALRRRRMREALGAADPAAASGWLDVGMGVADAWWGVAAGFLLGPEADPRATDR